MRKADIDGKATIFSTIRGLVEPDPSFCAVGRQETPVPADRYGEAIHTARLEGRLHHSGIRRAASGRLVVVSNRQGFLGSLLCIVPPDPPRRVHPLRL